MRLSLCMIIKNEERFLEACLLSVKDSVDEIIILDTGSTDRSVAIAQKFTDKIFPYTWQDHYSEARNAAIEKSSGNWILSLDADETIPKEEDGKLRELIQDEKNWGYVFIQRNYLKDGSGIASDFMPNDHRYLEAEEYAGFVEARMVRLFQKKPGVAFEGRVHDQVYTSINRLGGHVETAPFPILHFGKAERNQLDLKHKQKFFLEKGKLKVEESGNAPYAWFEYGKQALELGLIREAEEPLILAWKGMPDYLAAPFNLGLCYRAQGKKEKALELFTACIRLNPDTCFSYAQIGSLYMEQGKMSDAKPYLDKALEVNPGYAEGHFFLGVFHEIRKDFPQAFSEYEKVLSFVPRHSTALEALGRLNFGAKNWKKSMECFEQALTLRPQDARLRHNFSQAAFRAGMQHENEKQIQEAVEVYKTILKIDPAATKALEERIRELQKLALP